MLIYLIDFLVGKGVFYQAGISLFFFNKFSILRLCSMLEERLVEIGF